MSGSPQCDSFQPVLPMPAPGFHSSTWALLQHLGPLQLRMWLCALAFNEQSVCANIVYGPLPRGFAASCSGSY